MKKETIQKEKSSIEKHTLQTGDEYKHLVFVGFNTIGRCPVWIEKNDPRHKNKKYK